MDFLTAQAVMVYNDYLKSLTFDVLTLIVLFLLFYGVGIFFGRSRLTALIISLYTSSVLFLVFPYTYNLTFIRNVPNSQVWSGFCVYLVILALSYILVSRMIYTHEWYGVKRWLYTMLLAIVGVAQAIALGYNFLPFKNIILLSDGMYAFFHNPLISFILILGPLIFIFATRDHLD